MSNYVYLISDEDGAVAAFTRKWKAVTYVLRLKEATPHRLKVKVERIRSSIFNNDRESIVDITDEVLG